MPRRHVGAAAPPAVPAGPLGRALKQQRRRFPHHARRDLHRQRDDAALGLPAFHRLRAMVERVDLDAVLALRHLDCLGQVA